MDQELKENLSRFIEESVKKQLNEILRTQNRNITTGRISTIDKKNYTASVNLSGNKSNSTVTLNLARSMDLTDASVGQTAVIISPDINITTQSFVIGIF